MMKKTGLFFGVETKKTAEAAKKIAEAFGAENIEMVAVEEAWDQDFESYSYIIAGAATWFDGELPTYWDELVPEISALNLKGKKVAIFGLGDQKKYPDNFADSIGLLADAFKAAGAVVVGHTSPQGYQFTHSRALKEGKFQGLALDMENQAKESDQRIKEWVVQLKKEFI